MKEKHIKSVLNKKFNDFLKSIDDDYVKDLVRHNTIITGGCIASMLLKEKINDFDIYFRTKETVKAVAEYYVAKFKAMHPDNDTAQAMIILDGEKDVDPNKINLQSGFRYMNLTPDRIKIIVPSKGIVGDMQEDDPDKYIIERDIEDISTLDKVEMEVAETELVIGKKDKYVPLFLSSNAITLSGKIQLIIRFWGEPEIIHSNYDFVHCTNYWTSKENEVVLNQKALTSLLAKELIYQGSKYPVASVIRIRKFVQRGWHINAGQIFKILLQVSELNLKDIAVLEDQLVGVDTAYFSMLINILSDAIEKNPGKAIENSYICTIVDKLF